MLKQGKIVRWDDEKGFGFIDPASGGKQIFVHIKAFPRGMRRPEIGMNVIYVESNDSLGRFRAEQIGLLDEKSSIGPASKAFAVSASFLLVLAVIAWRGVLPLQFFLFYAGMSIVTFLMYALDKSSARKDGQRTPENMLHMLALVGGWPGALYAQQLLRHKSVKQPFRSIFWLTLALNITALGYLASDHGAWLVDRFINML
jgi:uncharacterized membrane protein YsdA (DUF1294 family)/cold shock CspA family protein